MWTSAAPGPDGMFEDWNGTLTCVQVVRVPLLAGLDAREMEERLVQKVIAKVVKSQAWLRQVNVVPNDFVIFCWLPFAIPDSVAAHALALMERVRSRDPRFSLRLRAAADSSSLFPALFACNHELRKGTSLSESDVSSHTASEQDSDEDEACEWDITWGWELEWGASLEESPREESHAIHSDDESASDLDITWDWEREWGVSGGEHYGMEGGGEKDGGVGVNAGQVRCASVGSRDGSFREGGEEEVAVRTRIFTWDDDDG